MTVWCKPNTIFKQRYALQTAGLIALCVALITTLLFGTVSRATAGINQTLSYSGRLLTASGAVVPDGHYNIQFKIYQDGDGTASGNPGGTLKWTESRINNGGTSGVEVTNGFFSVNLGSVNPFGSNVDWNQDTLWLSMNIAGSSASCTSFGSSPCTADGEMLPMKRITSTPYAMNAGQLGGKTANNFIQLSQGVQEDTASNSSSIFLNKTGSGGEFLKLQDSGTDVLSILKSGDIQFGNQSDHSIIIGSADTNTNGKSLLLQSGNGGSGSGSNGGNFSLFGGLGGGTNGNGGSVFIQGGDGTGSGSDGSVLIGNFNKAYIEIGNANLSSGSQTINIGNNNTSGGTTNITIGSGGSATGGSTAIQSKDSTTISTNGSTRATFDSSNHLTLSTITQLNNTTNVTNNQILAFGIQGASGSYTKENNGFGAYMYNASDSLRIGITPYATAGSSVSPTTVANDALYIASAAGGSGSLIKSGITYGPNLIDNGGFEANDCTAWKGCSFNNTVVHSGNFASQYVMSSSTSANSLIAPNLISAQPGDVFYVEGWIRTTAATTGTASVQICYYDKSRAWLNLCNGGTGTNPGTTWTLRSVTGSPAPANTAYVQIKFYNDGNGSTAGTWYYDDMYVAKANHQETTLYKNSIDTSNAFQIQNSNANTLFNVNTSNGTVSVGSDGSATSGATIIQSKDDTTVSTNGTQRARFSGSSNTLYVGNADSSGQATTANAFTIQGTSSTGSNTQGGSLTLQAGAATNGNANGGNLTLSGGSGVGTGANGLVIINTPTFQTTSNDANCYTGGALVASNCTFASASVNGSSVLIAGFNTTGKTATLPDPTNTTAGRIIYITAANGSSDFTLRANSGAGTGIEQYITMRQNTTVAMIWNGSDWTTPSSSNSTTLQDAYNNMYQSAGDAELVLSSGNSPDGFAIRDGSSNSINGALLTVQSSSAATLFSVNSNTGELATNPGAETAGASSSTFPSNTWGPNYSATVSRYTTTGNNVASGKASTKVETAWSWEGALNQLGSSLTANSAYNVTFSARAASGTINDLLVYYFVDADGSGGIAYCQDNVTITSSAWTKVQCTFYTPASGITSANKLFIGVDNNGSKTYYIDNLSVTPSASNRTAPNVQVGGGSKGGPTTLFTLDKSSSAPADGNDALVGSMYYDTTIGKIQCYEANGWGSCGDKPDNFITISPEYTNAVTHSNGTGTLTSDFCSDSLDINDGTSAQPTICGTKETYNFYKWTSSQASTQSEDIYVTYKLPSTFNNFVTGSLSLAGRTDSSDSSVAYQVYKNNSSNGLTACGSSVSVSTGSQTTWQTIAASGGANPSSCSFAAGDSIVIKITLSAKSNANAYVSNLNFVYSNQ